MPFGRYLIPHFPNLSVLSDPKRHPHDAEERFPKERFHPTRAVGFDHLELSIGEEREIQPVLAFEFRLCLNRIPTAPNDGRIQRLEAADRVTKLGRFVRSTGRVGLRKKIEDQILATKLAERNRTPVVSRGLERGCLVAFLKHLFVSGHTPVITQEVVGGFHSPVAD